jgi:hypothetical protein
MANPHPEERRSRRLSKGGAGPHGSRRAKPVVGPRCRVETGINGVEDLPSFALHSRRIFRCCFQNRSSANTVRSRISRPMETRMPGNRNIMYLIIGALIVAVGVLGYNLYQTKKEPEGLQINLGPNGLKIQNK